LARLKIYNGTRLNIPFQCFDTVGWAT